MKSVILGDSNLSVSELCLGTMYFGIKVPEEDAFRLMDLYYEAGGRFFDTANKYATWVPGFPEPVGEHFISRWIESRKNRASIIIATKIGFPYLDVSQGLTRKLIIQETEKSLERLGTDHIDLLYAHTDDTETPQEEVMEAFDKLIQSGKVRAVGASNFSSWRLALANTTARTNGWSSYCCTQTRLSPLWPKVHADFGRQVPASPEILDYCRSNSVSVLAYSPLLQGFFGRDDRNIPDGYDTADNRRIVSLIRKEAKEQNLNPNVVALAWMKEQGFIPLITGSNPDQINQNLQSTSVNISPETNREINRLYFPKEETGFKV